MSMTLTQDLLDRAALVVVAGEDGLLQWSSTKPHEEVASYLEGVAKMIRDEGRAKNSITCPVCGRTSHNPNDIREGYCGNCHQWTSPRRPEA